MSDFGPLEDLGVHLVGLIGRGVGEDLDLVELVDPQQAAGVAPGRARLTPEARGVGHQPHRQLVGRQDLVAGQRGERHLGGGDGPQVVPLEVVGVVDELGQVTGADHGVGEHQRRRPHLLVEVGVAIERQLAQRPHEAGPQPAVHHEHRARHLHGPLDVEDPELGTDVPVRDPLVLGVGVGVVPDLADDHVVVGAGAVGAVGGGQVGDAEQQLAEGGRDLVGLGPQAPAPRRPAPVTAAWIASAPSTSPALRS